MRREHKAKQLRDLFWNSWGVIAVAVLVALFAILLYIRTTIFLAAGDVAKAIASSRELPSFLDLQQHVPYDWWLLAQVWLMKLIGLLSLQSLKMTSALWALAGLFSIIWTSRRVLTFNWPATLLTMSLYVCSAQVITWAKYGFNRYAASIALGGFTFGLVLKLIQSELRPSATLAATTTLVFAAACLYAPPAAFLIAAGLFVAWLTTFHSRSVADISKRFMMCVIIGLPAALICIPTAILYPHNQMGNPPDYAQHLLLQPGSSPIEAVQFLIARMGTLMDSVFAANTRIDLLIVGTATMFTVLGAIGPWIGRRHPTQWAAAVIIGLSLAPAAVLSLYAWYPFGWVRYEYYACIPLMLLLGIGVEQIYRFLNREAGTIWPIRQLVTAAIAMAVVATLSLQVLLSMKFHKMSSETKQSALLAKEWMTLNSDCPMIIDFYTKSQLRMAEMLPRNVLFEIPRSTMRQNTTRQSLIKQFNDRISAHERVGVITNWKFQSDRYSPFVEIFQEAGFKKTRNNPGRWRLTVWSRTNH